MLQRIRDLRVQYANGTLDTTDQEAIASEVKELATEIYDIAEKTSFNGIELLSGDATDGDAGVAGVQVKFQVGAGGTDTIDISSTATADFTAGDAMAAIDITDSNTLQSAITEVSTQRAELAA